MPKDYYVILGLSRGADLDQIKRAYRKIAKRHHPDLTRSHSAEKFMEIKEAYDTLSDAHLRQKYDRGLDCPPESVPVHAVSKPHRRRAVIEPVQPFTSALDEFFEGLVPGLFLNPGRYRTSTKDLYYEVVLSRYEAHRGGLFPIRIPVLQQCPQCDRDIAWSVSTCPACHGHGYVQAYRGFSLSIPPRTSHGTQVTLSLEDIGLKDTRLYVRVHVDPWLQNDDF
jgi:molecular chaperone DnaJ